MKSEIVKITELKKDDIFSFRTVMKPIYFRFVELKQGIITYEEIKSKFQHTSQTSLTIVRKKIK
jgi:hypothetical protein